MTGPRRSSFSNMPVAYAAIGASGAPDLMRFPPADSTPYEEALQLGSGSERFLTAANLLMTWNAHRAAGLEVVDIERGERADYVGVQYADGVTPELGDEPEELFSPDGVAYVLPGATATFVSKDGQKRPVLVISTIDEEDRLGFAWGDREEVPGFGEQLITVEKRADGTVWAVARGFMFPQATGLLSGRKQRSEMRDVTDLAQALIGALAPGVAIREGVAPEVSGQPADDAAEHSAGDSAEQSVELSGDKPADATPAQEG